MRHSVKIFSRIGELLQGILPDGSHFLVSGLPSPHFFSEAIIEDTSVASGGPRLSNGLILPPKARRALDLFWTAHPQQAAMTGKTIRLYSNIPPGKGLSSSSADILSVLSVVNDYLGTGLTPQDLYAFAAAVEPTDPCLSGDDIVVFRQHQGIVSRRFSLPRLSMIWFDSAPDRQVDTIGLQRSYRKEASGYFSQLLDRFGLAAEQEDYAGLFSAITESALYNQSFVPVPHFDEYHQLAIHAGAGLMVAHSGTIIGLLTRPDEYTALLPVIGSIARRHRVATTDGPTLHIEQYYSNEPAIL